MPCEAVNVLYPPFFLFEELRWFWIPCTCGRIAPAKEQEIEEHTAEHHSGTSPDNHPLVGEPGWLLRTDDLVTLGATNLLFLGIGLHLESLGAIWTVNAIGHLDDLPTGLNSAFTTQGARTQTNIRRKTRVSAALSRRGLRLISAPWNPNSAARRDPCSCLGPRAQGSAHSVRGCLAEGVPSRVNWRKGG